MTWRESHEKYEYEQNDEASEKNATRNGKSTT